MEIGSVTVEVVFDANTPNATSEAPTRDLSRAILTGIDNPARGYTGPPKKLDPVSGTG